MFKMSFAVFRKPGLTQEEFCRHWRQVHAPLAIKHAGALRIRDYVQLHGQDCEAARLMTQSRQCQPPHDGVCQIWWDSEEDRLAASRTPEGQAASRELHEDELRFCDMSRATVAFGHENVVIDTLKPGEDRGKLLKMSFCVYRRPDFSREQFLEYWKTVHAAMAVKYQGLMRIRRYVQLHAGDHEVTEMMTQSRQCRPPHDGVVELWWDSEADRLAPGQTAEGREAARLFQEDELRFCDMARASICFGHENPVIANGQPV